MDNRLFNINGRTKEQLELAIKLLLLDEYGDTKKVEGWYFDEKKGFVLTWYDSKDYINPFTNRLGQKEPIEQSELVELLWKWKDSEEAKKVELCEWEEDTDHDGSNEMGWRLYTEDWGHTYRGPSLDHYSIAAFKPCWLWYGK